MTATRSSVARTAGAITTVDRRAARAYDSSYPVTAHAPRGCASLLRSSASTWTVRPTPPPASPSSPRSWTVSRPKRKGDLAYAYFWRGQAYYGKKRADQMVSDFETFLKLAPKAPEAPVVRQLISSLG